jgi:hypothetical protein
MRIAPSWARDEAPDPVETAFERLRPCQRAARPLGGIGDIAVRPAHPPAVANHHIDERTVGHGLNHAASNGLIDAAQVRLNGADRTSARNDEDARVPVAFGDVAKGPENPFRHSFVGFAAIGYRAFALKPACEISAETLIDLSAGQASPQTEVDFPQTRVCLDLKSVTFRDDDGCLVRALGIAAVDGVGVRNLGGQLGRLPTPHVVNRGPVCPSQRRSRFHSV